MKGKFCQILISATNKSEANKISDNLVRKKLIAGSLIIKGPSRYWWRGKIVEKTYFNIQAFSVRENKQLIVREVKKIHSDKCPIVAFLQIDGNQDFLNWIRVSLKR
ncbi:MAG: divalent cation tolerance protein CutA [bacterium]|nr:divalent cation tolerance protein CutA [bacterium]